MILTVARFELWSCLRSYLFWDIAITFLAIGYFSYAGGGGFFGGGANLAINAPFNLMLSMAIFSVFAMFITVALVANTVTRDFELGTAQIVFSLPMHWSDYLFGRFVGGTAAAILAFAPLPVGMALGTHLSWVNPVLVGPFHVSHYLYAFAVFGVSNLFITASLFFAVATLTRNPIVGYVAAVVLLAFALLASTLGRDADNSNVFAVSLLDPFAWNTFLRETRYWTPTEQSQQLLPLAGGLLWNRLTWMVLAIVAVAATAWRFDPYPCNGRRRPTQLGDARGQAQPQQHRVHIVRPRFIRSARWWQLLVRTRLEVWSVIGSAPFLVLLAVGVLLIFSGLRNPSPLFGTPSLPLTHIVTTQLETQFAGILLIVTTYYAGEIVWRERRYGFEQIVDALPVDNWVFFISKLVALLAALAVLLAAVVATMMLFQLSAGIAELNLSIYVQRVFVHLLAPYCLLAVLAVFLQVISPNKYLGMLLMVIVLALRGTGSALLEKADLIVFASHPQVPWSDMYSSTFFLLESMEYDLYWSFLATALALGAYVLWKRGADQGWGARWREARMLARAKVQMAIALALAAFVASGTYIYIEDFVRNPLPNDKAYERWMARRERELAPHIHKVQPSIDALRDLEIAHYPHERYVTGRGRYVLRNRSGEAIPSVQVSVEPFTRVQTLAIDGDAPTASWPQYRFYVFKLSRPMAPGETRTLEFSTRYERRDFPAASKPEELIDNGSVVSGISVLPSVGDIMRLTEPEARRRQQLPPLETFASLESGKNRDLSALGESGEGGGVRRIAPGEYLHTFVVSTVVDQHMFASGSDLLQEWSAAGRRYFRFGAKIPSAGSTLISGRYQVARAQADGVELSIHYHPSHAYHVKRYIRALSVSMDYYHRNLGPYVYNELPMIEIPGEGAGGAALAGAFVGAGFFTQDLSLGRDLDVGTFIVAHETAHQWYPWMIPPARVDGASVLSETLAQYGAEMVLEKMYGQASVRRALRSFIDRYYIERAASTEREMPLYRVAEGEANTYVNTWRGAIVMYTLRDVLGEFAMNHALRMYYDRWAFRSDRFPVTLDMIACIREQAPAKYQDLITDLTERVLSHELAVTQATVERLGDGHYKLRAEITARKLEQGPDGHERPVAMHDPVEIVVYGSQIGSHDRYAAQTIASARRWLMNGRSIHEFVLTEKPYAVAVDPYHNFVERNVDDNLRRL